MEDGNVGWRAAVLGVVVFSDGGEAVFKEALQLSGMGPIHSPQEIQQRPCCFN